MRTQFNNVINSRGNSKLKILIYSIFLSIIASSAFGAASWVASDLTEADILQKYQNRILHITTSTFSSSNNDLITTIITYDGTFRCTTVLPQVADKIVNTLTDEEVHCAMIKPPEEENKDKKKKKK